MSYQKRHRGIRILEVSDAKTGKILYPYLPQNKCVEVLDGFTTVDVSNIAKVITNERKSVAGYKFRLIGTMVDVVDYA